jgi:hypothetical protein
MRTTIHRLDAKLSGLSLVDPLDRQAFDELEEVRAKMRMVDVWLKRPRGKIGSADTIGDARLDAQEALRVAGAEQAVPGCRDPKSAQEGSASLAEPEDQRRMTTRPADDY